MGLLAAAQGIAGGSGLEAQEGDDSAGVGFLQGFPLVGMHAQDAGHLLRGLLDGIVDFLAEFQGAGIDAHIGEPLALVHHDLEGQGGQRLVIFGRAALRLPGLGVLAHNRRHLGGIGQEILDAVQQRLDALVAQGGAAVGGHPFQRQGGPLDAGLEGLHRQGLLRQVDLHHLVIHFRHGLHQGLPGRGGLVLIVGGDLEFLKSNAQGFFPPPDGPQAQKVDDALEVLFFAPGDGEDQGMGSQLLPQGLQRRRKICPHAVHFVNESQLGDPVLVRLVPDGFGLGLHPAHRVEDPDGPVQHPQGPFHLDGEIHVARGVDDVDDAALPLAGSDRRGDGDAPFLLLGHPVHDRGAVVDLAHLVGAAGVIEDALREGGLPRVDVGNDAEVANGLESGGGHGVHSEIDNLDL